jgi:predicted nucleic acid-binding protein
MQAVVADASPIRYLVLIGADPYLERIYERILIPSTVAAELQAARTPPPVQAWMKNPPRWVEVVPEPLPAKTHILSTSLDPGERAMLFV